ncbi:glycosyltransferase [Modicisalibacter radicis]|uniref:glycosyltransferase n=1 Tax=Halomonas sp. EAR18 TaxID=2518972 RepID=UPI00109D3ECF|nr:glycosyltransferase [Halomonas sp. EAR18]
MIDPQVMEKGTTVSSQHEGSFLFLSDHLGGGGAPISILNLAQALVARGCRVTILVLSDKIWHEIPDGVHVQAIPFAYRNVWQKWNRFRLHARGVEKWLNESDETFDVVIANLYYAHQVVAHSCLSEKAWLCIRTDPTQALLGKSSFRWKARRKLKKLYGGKRVIAISSGIVESLAAHGVVPADARVIHNIIDAESIQGRMHETVDIDDYIVFVGRLDLRQKRYDRLLRAYRKSATSSKLVVVGDGDIAGASALAKELGVEDRVLFIGKTNNPYPYIHNARLLVLTSDYEGFGRVIAEALICGTPVVSTDCPSGPRDILTGELAECLVERDDEDKLATKIAQMIEQPPAILPGHYLRFAPEEISSRYLSLLASESSVTVR